MRRISSSRPITGSSLPCCALGQIDRVLVQRLTLALRLGAIDLMASAHGIDRRFQRLLRQSVLARESTKFALIVRYREQEHLACNEAVTAPLRLFICGVQQRIQFAPYLHLAVTALHLRQAFDEAIKRLRQRGDVDASSLQQRPGAGVALPQHRQQHVSRIDVLVVVTDSDRLRVGQRFWNFVVSLSRRMLDCDYWLATGIFWAHTRRIKAERARSALC